MRALKKPSLRLPWNTGGETLTSVASLRRPAEHEPVPWSEIG